MNQWSLQVTKSCYLNLEYFCFTSFKHGTTGLLKLTFQDFRKWKKKISCLKYFSYFIFLGVDDTSEVVDERPIYTLYTQEGAPCIMIKTDAIFNLNYRTLRHGIKSVRIVLPGN